MKIERIPYGVSKMTAGWWIFIIVTLILIALGIFAYSRQVALGEVATGMRDIGTGGGAVWGLYIVFLVYFICVGFAGTIVAALIPLLNMSELRPVSRMGELLKIISTILAVLCILVDIGQPLRGIVNLVLYARPQSPFFGTFTLLISGYLFASLVYFYLEGRRDAFLCAQVPGKLQWFYKLWAAGYQDTEEERKRHCRTSFWLSLAIIPLFIITISILGSVFGIQVGRPGWFSALQAPALVILGGVSGIGMLIMIAIILRKTLGLKDQIKLETFRLLNNFLLVSVATYLYFMVVEWLTFTYTAHEAERHVYMAITAGKYAWVFWLSVAMLVLSFIILGIQYLGQFVSLGLLFLVGVMTNIVAIFKSFLIVVPSQTYGTLLPFPAGYYSPTWVEYSIIIGLFALGALLYTIFVKIFPITEITVEEAK